jgi:hypothetical protein
MLSRPFAKSLKEMMESDPEKWKRMGEKEKKNT